MPHPLQPKLQLNDKVLSSTASNDHLAAAAAKYIPEDLLTVHTYKVPPSLPPSLPPPPIDVHKRRKLSIPSHSPMGQWDIPRDVHLSLYRCMCVPLSIPSHGPMGQWDCPSHPMVPWNSGAFHGMSTCPSYRYSHCSFHSTIP